MKKEQQEYILVSVPPSWLIMGRLAPSEESEIMILRPARYCESIESGTSIFGLCAPGKGNVVSLSWPIPELRVRRDAVLISARVDPDRGRALLGTEALAALDKVV